MRMWPGGLHQAGASDTCPSPSQMGAKATGPETAPEVGAGCILHPCSHLWSPTGQNGMDIPWLSAAVMISDHYAVGDSVSYSQPLVIPTQGMGVMQI